jgi:hypothetical protein
MRSKLLAAAVLAAFGAVSVSAHAAPGDTTLGGKMYFDFTNISQKNSDTGKTDKTGTGTDVKRFYLSVTHQFDDIWSVNLTTDFNYVPNDGETNLFVKKAYIQGKFSDAAVLRLGSADMPWIPFVEHYYGYRYVENTITDRLHYANSADWGVHLQGKLGGMANYSAAIVNGGGYKHPGRSKGVDVEGRVAFSPVDGMVLALGGYSGKLGKDTQTVSAPNTASRIDGMVAYASKQLRVGGEYFQAKNWGNAVTGMKDKADGYSVWASYQFADNLAVFGRYDSAKQSKDLDPKKKDTYYNAGVSMKVTKGFDLAFVYKHEKSDFSSNYGGMPHVANIKTDEVGAWAQVAF